jgi:hypothetical protein
MNAPEFRFFRTTPPKLVDNPPLASSLQAFETSLELIAFHRFPAALIACVNAWESALKAAFKIEEAPRTPSLRELLNRSETAIIRSASWDTDKNLKLINKRNQITHYGYTPKDSSVCATLLLETAYPGLACIYEYFFDYRLMWQQLGDSPNTSESLSKSDLDKVGLISQWGDPLWLAVNQFQRQQATQKLSPTWYFHPLASALRLGFQRSWTSSAEHETLVLTESDGVFYEQQEQIRSQVVRQMSDCKTTLFCPICDASDTFIIEFDEDAFAEGQMATKRCVCVACYFSLPSAAGFLIPALVNEDLFPRWQALRIDCGLE